MRTTVLLLAAAATTLAVGPAFARGAPAGAGGPPPGVTVGPPAAALAHIPHGLSVGPPPGVVAGRPQVAHVAPPPQSDARHHPSADPDAVGDLHGTPADPDDVKNGGDSLGNLNAAHASPTALEHASPHSIVGKLAQ